MCLKACMKHFLSSLHSFLSYVVLIQVYFSNFLDSREMPFVEETIADISVSLAI